MDTESEYSSRHSRICRIPPFHFGTRQMERASQLFVEPRIIARPITYSETNAPGLYFRINVLSIVSKSGPNDNNPSLIKEFTDATLFLFIPRLCHCYLGPRTLTIHVKQFATRSNNMLYLTPNFQFVGPHTRLRAFLTS